MQNRFPGFWLYQGIKQYCCARDSRAEKYEWYLLTKVVAGNEIWIHRYELPRKIKKINEMETHRFNQKQFKAILSKGKSMATMFYNENGVITLMLCSMAPVSSSNCYMIILSKIRAMLHCDGLLLNMNDMLLQHENA